MAGTSRTGNREPPERAKSAAGPTGLAEAPAGFALSTDARPGIRKLSLAARELILRHKSGGRAHYETKLKSRPHWPGFASGIAIGFGWDLGYHTRAELAQAWLPILGPASRIGAPLLSGCAPRSPIDRPR